jgi:predicted phosphodiesterase
MRIAVISDVHANSKALSAVIKDAVTKKVTRFWLLGDLIGYGIEPVETIELLTKMNSKPFEWVFGNHEAIFSRMDELPESVDLKAKLSSTWNRVSINNDGRSGELITDHFPSETRLFRMDDGFNYLLNHNLFEGNKDYLDGYASYPLPWNELVLRSRGKTVDLLVNEQIFEGTLINEKLFSLTTEAYTGNANFPLVVFHGHTHVPGFVMINEEDFESKKFFFGEELSYKRSRLTFINPGSVGQPRDGIPMASYLILNTRRKSVTMHRVDYDRMSMAHKYDSIGTIGDGTQRLTQMNAAFELKRILLNPPIVDKNIPPDWKKHLGEQKQRLKNE